MQMQGIRQLRATQAQVWQALNDPAVLQQCIPGCQTFEAQAPNVYKITANVKIGPFSADVSGQLEITNIQPPRAYSMHFAMQSDLTGSVTCSTHLELSETEQGVELSYNMEPQADDMLAQVSQHLIDSFFNRFEQIVNEQNNATTPPATPETPTPETSVSAATPTSPPATARFPKWLWLAVAVSIVMILIVM